MPNMTTEQFEAARRDRHFLIGLALLAALFFAVTVW
jgi:hypothetical protein